MKQYKYISKEDILELKTVNSNSNLDKLLQTALSFDKTILIEEEYYYIKHKWWIFNGKKMKRFRYTLYHESRSEEGVYARYISAAGHDVRTISAYLFGIINGCLNKEKETK